MVKVMVVDDHPMWRDAVERDLESAGHQVVAVAADGREAMARFPAAAPQVVVLDLQLPDNTGVQITGMMLEHDPTARVLILSASGEQGDVLEAIKAGATGYLVKSASSAELIDAVVHVADGEAVFTPGLAGLVLGEFRRIADGPPDSPVDQLTERETEILKMVATGMSYKQIAGRLVLSHRTVQNHVQNTLRKLQMNNRVQLTRWAIEHGLDGDAACLRRHPRLELGDHPVVDVRSLQLDAPDVAVRCSAGLGHAFHGRRARQREHGRGTDHPGLGCGAMGVAHVQRGRQGERPPRLLVADGHRADEDVAAAEPSWRGRSGTSCADRRCRPDRTQGPRRQGPARPPLASTTPSGASGSASDTRRSGRVERINWRTAMVPSAETSDST